MIPPQKKLQSTAFPSALFFCDSIPAGKNRQKNCETPNRKKICRKLMKMRPLMPFSSLPGAERLQERQAVRDLWCQEHYPFHEPVRARPLPVRPDPHLPEGRDVGDLHDETVLLAPLKPAGIATPQRFSCCFTASLHLRPVPQPWPCQQPQIKTLWVLFIGLELSCAAITSYFAVGKTPRCRFDRDSSFPGKHSPPGAAPDSL